MARLNIAPTKANLLSIKEQLAVSLDGYDLLEQKREILVMELMKMLERVKLLEERIDGLIEKAYSSLKKMLINYGSDSVQMASNFTSYDFNIKRKHVNIAGLSFPTIDLELPQKKLFYSPLGSGPDFDAVTSDFFELLKLLTQMASIRTIVWRLVADVRKTQRRVNALDKMVIPQTTETKKYIESVLEERERENTFTLKALKRRTEEGL